jgi:hypothetical protein
MLRAALRPPAVAALAGWTLFVWATRIGNIWNDDDAGTGAKVTSTALALSFTVLALAVLVTGWRQAERGRWTAVVGLAAWTTGVWVVRMATIAPGDREVGFKVVHGVLAAVSIALAAWAVRSLRSRRVGRVAGSAEGPRSAVVERT